MRALLRNPLVQLGMRLWWLPTLAVVALAFFPGVGGGLPWLLVGLGACCGLALGIVGVPFLQGLARSGQEHQRHRRAQHRFLCSSCMELSDLRYACADCGKEVEALVVHTGGRYANRCPHCNEILAMTDTGILSLCGGCGATDERAVAHERAVRVVGTLLADDFDLFASQAEPLPAMSGGCRWLRIDDGRCLTYLLSLDDLNARGEALSPGHAARSVETLWLSDSEPLRLGRALDGFLTRAEISDGQLATMTVCVGAERLDPAAARLLAARLGTIKYSVPESSFFPLAAGSSATAGRCLAGETAAIPRETAQVSQGGRA